MSLTAIGALVRNDLRLYRADRRALIIGILVPIAIAAFFGYVFGGSGSGSQQSGRLPVAVVDEDHSSVSRAIISELSADSMLDVTSLDRETARDQVRRGTQDAAAVFPQGFGQRSVRALFNDQDRPEVELFTDPSQAMSARLLQGLLAQYSMQAISREAFSGALGRQGLDALTAELEQQPAGDQRNELLTLMQSARRLNAMQAGEGAPASGGPQAGLGIPYEVTATAVVARAGTPYNSYAHSFAGMTVQFILFAGIDAGVMLLLLRQRGLWQRIRAAPVGRGQFVLARMLSTAVISLFQLTVVYIAAMAVFGVRIMGSVPGFLSVAISFCLLNAAFGLMLATVGRSAPATRGIATMLMLLLVMLGGAWVPSFVFPQWLQDAARFTPTFWAVEGLDAMTWRGLPFADAVVPSVVLLGAALACLGVAIWRFRWEE